MSFALAPAFRLIDWQSFNFRILLFIAKLGYFCIMSTNNFLLKFKTTFCFCQHCTQQPFAYIPYQLSLLQYYTPTFRFYQTAAFRSHNRRQPLTNMFTFYNLFVTYFVYIFTNSL